MNTVLDLIRYNVSDAAIAEMRDQYMDLVVKDPTDMAGFKVAHDARMIVRGKRCEIEKCRVRFKAEALGFGRKVDSEARRITDALEPIEEHLAAQERIVTDEKERKIREAAEAARLKREAEEKAVRDAEEARIWAEHEAEAAKLKAEREAFAAQQKKEREEWAAARAEIEAQQKAAQETLAAERVKAEAAQQVERDRLAAIEAKQRAEQERIDRIVAEGARREREAAAVAEAKALAEREAERKAMYEEEQKQQAEAEKARLDALRPDAEKLQAYGAALLAVPMPAVKTPEGAAFLEKVAATVGRVAGKCNTFVQDSGG